MWLLWAQLGLFPLPTTPIYLLGSPMFPDINITVNYNRTLRIQANGIDQGPYVQSMTVNGQPWNRNWIEHQDVMVNGGSIVFELGAENKTWETGSPPPSLGHVEL